jgi:rare lipoprotein A
MDRSGSAPASRRVIANGQPIPKGGGGYKVGNPYQVDGQWHTPREDPDYDRVGTASYYAGDFHGRRTANGEIFDMSALSAAHPTLPLPSLVYVTNMENGRTLLLRVNDRGPYVNNRVIDVSRAAARYLGFETRGTARVRVRYAGRAPLTGDDRQEQRFLANQAWFRVALSHEPYASR